MSEEQKSSVQKRRSHHAGFDSKRVLQEGSARSKRSAPRERSRTCSERSDKARDCKQHMTQTKDCTQHRLKPALHRHNTDECLHITQTKTNITNAQKTKTQHTQKRLYNTN